MDELRIRKFQASDQGGVSALYASGIDGYNHIPFVGATYAWYLRKRLSPEGDMSNVQSVYMDNSDRDKSNFWVAEYDSKIVGCIGAVPSTSDKYAEDYVELIRMIVSAECRKMNVGRRLVKTLEDWAIEVGYKRVYLLTFSALVEPNILYQKCGYALTEEEDFDVSDKLGLPDTTNIAVAHYTKALV